MPSTRISMCLICACAAGATTIEPSKTSSAILLAFIVPPSSKVQPKLLRDSKTDVTADGHERGTCGMCNVPIHPEPNMHSGAHAYIGRDTAQQNVATTAVLVESRDAVILRMQPSQHGANEPFTCYVLRFIRTVRQPETRFDVTAEPSILCPP